MKHELANLNNTLRELHTELDGNPAHQEYLERLDATMDELRETFAEEVSLEQYFADCLTEALLERGFTAEDMPTYEEVLYQAGVLHIADVYALEGEHRAGDTSLEHYLANALTEAYTNLGFSDADLESILYAPIITEASSLHLIEISTLGETA